MKIFSKPSASESESIAFSGAWNVLGLLFVIPNTNATSGRSFSALKRLKTYLRTPTDMGVGRIFSTGRGRKAVKFVFYPSKLKKQPFLLKFSKSRGALPPLRRPCLGLVIA